MKVSIIYLSLFDCFWHSLVIFTEEKRNHGRSKSIDSYCQSRSDYNGTFSKSFFFIKKGSFLQITLKGSFNKSLYKSLDGFKNTFWPLKTISCWWNIFLNEVAHFFHPKSTQKDYRTFQACNSQTKGINIALSLYQVNQNTIMFSKILWKKIYKKKCLLNFTSPKNLL